MPEADINQLKNHQLLEVCGLEIFKNISKKKVIEDIRGEKDDSNGETILTKLQNVKI